MHFGEVGQAGEEIGRPAKDLLQLFGSIGGDFRAEAAGDHIEEEVAIGVSQVDGPWLDIQQHQRCIGLQGNARGAGEIIGGAQGQQHQAGVALGQGHRLGHFTQGAVTAPGDQRPVARGQGLVHQAAGVAALPGNPYRQVPARVTARLHGCTHLVVGRLLAMQDQQSLALTHAHLHRSGIARV
ncbi:hypothetical protein D9M68_684240 [compost metagenome]